MVSNALVKLSSPFAKSCLVAIGVVLIIDAALTIFAANSYPYLVAYTSELYVNESRSITIVYVGCSIAAILLALSSGWASYKSHTSYVLVHSCITGVFLPIFILAYFTSLSSRYKVNDFAGDFHQMITHYSLSNQQIRISDRGAKTVDSLDVSATVGPASGVNRSESNISTPASAAKFPNFINLIDSIQRTYSCCGVESPEDWVKELDHYIPPSCCDARIQETAPNEAWAHRFNMDSTKEFHYCPETSAHQLGCLAALKDDEKSKFAWLADLIVFLMVMTITNSIVSLLLFGLSRTEEMPYDADEHELAMVGVSTKPRPSQPEITSIRHRPSVIALGANKEQIASMSQAVRFNLNSSPKVSVSGPSKFSAAARRGSAHV